MTFRRSLMPLLTEIARLSAWEDNEEGITSADLKAETTVAPAVGEYRSLTAGSMVANTLELISPAGVPYLPYRDFFEDPVEGRWQNIRIPAGQALTAEYLTDSAETPSGGGFSGAAPAEAWRGVALLNGWVDTAAGAGEPAIYREGSRVYCRGVIMGGTVTAGTDLFTLPATHRPAHVVTLPVMSSAGPAVIDILSTGEVEIGDISPGSGWLTLDSLSWRWEYSAAFVNWGQTDIFFGSSDMDDLYSELD